MVIIIKKIVVKIFAMLLFIISINVECVISSERSYVISKQHINITINESGEGYVEEFLSYHFTGVFNGILMDIDYAGYGKLVDMQIFVLDGEQLVGVTQQSTQMPRTYEFEDSNNIAKYKIYEPSTDCVKTFVFKYTLTDAVTVFNDTAQFNRKIIAPNRSVITQNVTANIYLPEGASKEEVRIFIHGPLTGESKIESGKEVSLFVPQIEPSTFVETNLLFPNRLVPNASNRINENVLEKQLALEAEEANKANALRDYSKEQLELQKKYLEEAKMRKRLGFLLTILLSVFWLVFMIFIYYKFDKEFKVQFTAKYFRDLPGDYTPAEMSTLINFKKLYPRDLMATIMDLVRKKQLSIESIAVKQKGLLVLRDKEDFKISITEFYHNSNLCAHENFLIDWFINIIGNNGEVTLKDIKNYSKNYKTGIKFKENYDKWCTLVENSSAKYDFFDKTSSKGQIISILVNITLVAIAIFFMFYLKSNISITIIILGFVGILYSANIHRRSLYGQEQLEKWMAFKRFLKDFSQMDKAIVGSIILWVTKLLQ